jgi:cation-transporting ATPase E
VVKTPPPFSAAGRQDPQSSPSPNGERRRESLGLTDAEVAERVRSGLANDAAQPPSRTVGQILAANLLTRFNAILGALLAVVLVVGPYQDALFGIVLVTNATIGIIGEWRAKRTLDRLTVLTATRARVVRNGTVSEVAVTAVVIDDLVEVGPGDQFVADGVVDSAQGLEVDESLLTGESEPVPKPAGAEVRSGSFAVAGAGRYVVTRVGAEVYARRIADEARAFRLVRSELRAGIDRILRYVTWAIVPAAALLVASQVAHHHSPADAVRGSVAGVGAMIPEGLVLLTSTAFAVGAVRLGRRRVLVKELAAIEGLARVDVVCIDKTGTLTEPDLQLAAIIPVRAAVPATGAVPDGAGPVHAGDAAMPEAVLGALAAADPAPNAVFRALAAACPAPAGWAPDVTVAFSSVRKWSAAGFGAHGAWFLGGADVLSAVTGPVPAADAEAAAGRRVLLLARSPAGIDGETLPPVLRAEAVVVFEERLRPDAAETLRFLADEDVAVKILSGDDPRTVASVAERVGLAVAGAPVDARTLPSDPDGLGAVLESSTVFGRVTPEQKRAMVRALQARGHVVAMTGDGVNDVLALKEADIGVAMGAGSDASRAAARLVLLDNSFAAFPAVLAEGRRVIANVERVANLFVSKTVYALLLALAVGVARLPFPFYPRHLTIVSSLTIGIPAFFLALAPGSGRAHSGFVRRVLRFAGPAGLVAAAATFAGYALARAQDGTSLGEARTTATVVLFFVGLEILLILARPLTAARRWLIAAMLALFGLVLAVPASRTFFALDPPALVVILAAVGIAALADSLLEAGWQLVDRVLHRPFGVTPNPGPGPSAPAIRASGSADPGDGARRSNGETREAG